MNGYLLLFFFMAEIPFDYLSRKMANYLNWITCIPNMFYVVSSAQHDNHSPEHSGHPAQIFGHLHFISQLWLVTVEHQFWHPWFVLFFNSEWVIWLSSSPTIEDSVNGSIHSSIVTMKTHILSLSHKCISFTCLVSGGKINFINKTMKCTETYIR